MSLVHLLCADHPLPSYDSKVRRRYTQQVGRHCTYCEEDDFSVHPLQYYRAAVEDLGLSMKPFRYELDLRATAQDAALLRDYLSRHCTAGQQVELWRLWVGDVGVRAFRLAGRLADLDADTLAQLEEREQTCITLTI